MQFLISVPKPKRMVLADKLIEQQKGVVRHWRELWDKDREEKVSRQESENYKMYTMQILKLNAYNEMYLALTGTNEEADYISNALEA